MYGYRRRFRDCNVALTAVGGYADDYFDDLFLNLGGGFVVAVDWQLCHFSKGGFKFVDRFRCSFIFVRSTGVRFLRLSRRPHE